jgi:hypothetical protein
MWALLFRSWLASLQDLLLLAVLLWWQAGFLLRSKLLRKELFIVG